MSDSYRLDIESFTNHCSVLKPLQTSQMGKKRILATANINMRRYASIESTQQSFTLALKPVSKKITAAEMELTLSCVFLREGKAT